MKNELNNCPTTYYRNCSNALKKCKVCRAGFGRLSGELFYLPKLQDKDLLDHPSTKPLKGTKQSIYRRSRQTEKNIEQSIAKATLRSGALNHDGDLLFLESLRVEVKDRGIRSSWNLTWKEFSKGKDQHIDIYAINIECPDGKKRVMYMLEEDLLSELLGKHISEL